MSTENNDLGKLKGQSTTSPHALPARIRRDLKSLIGMKETENEAVVRRIDSLTVAKRRLKTLFGNDFGKNSEYSFIAHKVLDLYGYSKAQSEEITISAVHKLAHSLIASDLLIEEFYLPNGSLTNYAETYYPDINPEDFKVIPFDWEGTKNILQKRLEKKGWRVSAYDEYIGNLGAGGKGGADIVADYANIFGEGSVIALPFEISIESSYITMGHRDDFIPPYGGRYSNRMVYLPADEVV